MNVTIKSRVSLSVTAMIRRIQIAFISLTHTHSLSLTHPEYMTIEEIHCIRYIALQLIH